MNYTKPEMKNIYKKYCNALNELKKLESEYYWAFFHGSQKIKFEITTNIKKLKNEIEELETILNEIIDSI
jgi:hypothetical protein